jgi:tetratricopeptide (TPR) repeat protein
MSARIDEGKKLVEELRMAEAVRHFESLLNDPAEQMEAHLWLAKLRIGAGEPEVAEEHLAAVLRANPRQVEALALQGVLAMNSGNALEAVRLLEEVKKLDADQIVAHMNLAAGYRKLNRLPESLLAAREAVEHYPQNALARLQLARTLWQMNKKTEAKQAVLAALDIDPAFIPAYLELSGWLASEGGKHAAIVVLQRGVTVLPQNLDLREQLSHAYLDAGMTEEALEEARGLAQNRGWARDKAHLAACESRIAR